MKKAYFIPIIILFSLLFSGFVLFVIRIQLRNCAVIFIPTNIDDLKTLSDNLQLCYENHRITIHIFHAVCFLFLQTWCIPGTVLFNLFAGAVFGVYKGTLICLTLNTLGASFSFIISKYFLFEVFEYNQFLKSNKEKLKKLVESNKGNLVYYMIFLRIFPGSPNWLMNISFPHLNITTLKFAFTVFIGIAPWNFFSCSAGAILRQLTNTKEIMDSKKYLALIGLALSFLLIPVLKKKFNSADTKGENNKCNIN